MSVPLSLHTPEQVMHNLRETAGEAVDQLERAALNVQSNQSSLDRAIEALSLNAETIKSLERKTRSLVGCVNRMALTALVASICLIAAGVLLLPVCQPAAIFFIVAGSLMIAGGALDYFCHGSNRCTWEVEKGTAAAPPPTGTTPVETSPVTEEVQQ